MMPPKGGLMDQDRQQTAERVRAGNKREVDSWWRPLVAGIFVAVAAFALLGALITRYAERNILDTQGFTAIVGPLPENPQVATALANFTTDKVFNNVDVESEIRDFLPSNLAALASPLSSTLEDRANQIARDFIQSDAFNAAWITANQVMQKGVVRVAESRAPQGKLTSAAGSLNLSELINKVSERVNGEAALSDEQVARVATVRVDLQQRVDRLRTTVSAIHGGARALPFLAVALLLAALAVTYNRRHTLTTIGITLLLLSIAALIAFKVWSGGFLSGITNDSYNAAATAVYEAFYSDLRLRLVLTAISGALLIILATIAGPYDWARRLRHALAIDELRHTSVHRWAAGIRRWVAKYEAWISLAGMAAAIIWLLALSVLTPSTLVIVLSALVGFISIIHLVARPAPARMV